MTNATNIIIFGIGGRMGTAVYEALRFNDNVNVVFGVDKFADPVKYDVPIYSNLSDSTESADVIVDFSKPDAMDEILSYATSTSTNVVFCTTGYSAKQQAKIDEASERIAIFQSANMSLGVNLLIELVKTAAKFLGHTYDVEIIEQHHNKKVDAPSGTALMIADGINEVFDNSLEYVMGRNLSTPKRTDHEIGIHAVRGGTIVGKHDVLFIGSEEIVTIAHSAQSRSVFALGAIRAAEFLKDKQNGKYCMNDLIGRDYSVTTVEKKDNTALISVDNCDITTMLAIFDELALDGINVDMISQCGTPCDMSLSFTVESNQLTIAENAVRKVTDSYCVKDNTANITILGPGMKHQSGVARDILKTICSTVQVHAVTTSETEITCCIDSDNLMIVDDKLKEKYGLNSAEQ